MSYDRGRGPPSIEGMTSLKVDNLTYRTTVDDLKKVFREYGDVGDVYIPRDARTNQSRGFAFVRFYERRDAEDAMDRVDGTILDGREIRVQHAKYGRPQNDYRQRSSGRDRGYDRSRGRRSYSPRRRRSRSRSYSPRRRSRSPRNKRSRSRSQSPRRRQSRSPQQERRRGSGSPSPRKTSQSPEQNGSPARRRRSSSADKSS